MRKIWHIDLNLTRQEYVELLELCKLHDETPTSFVYRMYTHGVTAMLIDMGLDPSKTYERTDDIII